MTRSTKTIDVTFNAAIVSMDSLLSTIKSGMIVYDRLTRDSKGLPRRWKIGKIQTWKRDRSRIKITVQHGLYTFDYIESLENFNTYLSTDYTQV